MANLWAEFTKLLAPLPQVVGDIVTKQDDVYYIQLVGGGTMKCAGNGTYQEGDRVVVQQGRILFKSVSLPYSELEV